MKGTGKRFLAVLLSLLMVLGTASSVWAETPEAEATVGENIQTESENPTEPEELTDLGTNLQNEDALPPKTSETSENDADQEKSSFTEDGEASSSSVSEKSDTVAAIGSGVSNEGTGIPENTSSAEGTEKEAEPDQKFEIYKTELTETEVGFFAVAYAKSSTYDRIYVGSREDADKMPVVEGIPEITGGYSFRFPVEESQLGQKITLVPGNKAEDTWYLAEDVYCEIPVSDNQEVVGITRLMSSLAAAVPMLLLAEEAAVPANTEAETDAGIKAIYANVEANGTKAGNDYSMFKIASSTAKVNGDVIDITLYVSAAANGNYTYDAIYIGSKDDETKEPLVMGTVDAELGKEVFSFSVPLTAQGTEVTFVPRSASKGTFSTSSVLALTIPKFETETPTPTPTPTPEPEPETDAGIKAIYANVEANGTKAGNDYSMFKIASSTAKVNGDVIDITLYVSAAASGNYTYDAIYIGSKDDETKEPLVMGTVDAELGKEVFSFSVPLTAQGTEVTFVPRSASKGTFSTSSVLALTIPKFETEAPTPTPTPTPEPEPEPEEPVQITEVKVLKEDGTEFAMFKIGEYTLSVKGDQIEVYISTNNTSFDKFYLGANEDADKTPVVAGTQKTNGGWEFTFTVPLDKKGTSMPICLGKTDGSWYTSRNLVITIPDVNTEDGPVLEDAGINIKAGGAEYNHRSFPITSSSAKLKGDQVEITITAGTVDYDRMYLGSKSDAVKEPVITGTSDGTTTTFTFSVSADLQGLYIPITLGVKGGAWENTAVDYFILIPNLNKTVSAEDYTDGVYDIYGNAVTANQMIPIDKGSNIALSGDQATVTLITRTSYADKLYLGSVSDSEEVKDANAVSCTNLENDPERTDYKVFTFTVPRSAIGTAVPMVLHIKNSNSWSTKQDVLNLSLFMQKIGDLEPNPEPEPEPSDVPEDGIYQTTAETGAAMFKVVDVKLTAKDGQMSAIITLSGTGYDYLYMGSAEEAGSADDAALIPVKESVAYTDGNGNEKTGYSYEIPVAALDIPLAVASHSISKNAWYDRTITISSANLEKIGDVSNAPENGIYQTTAETGAAMFKVVDVKLTAKDGQMSAIITLSGTGYDYLYMGSAEEAGQAGSAALIPVKTSVVYTDGNGNEKTGYSYEIPVAALDIPLAVASHSISKDIWYDRTITISSANLEKIGELPDSGNTPGTDTPGSGDSGNGGGSTPSKPPVNDGTADTESKYETDLSGSTSAVNSSTNLPDGVYTPDGFSWSGGTGKVSISCSKITIQNGQALATIEFSSSSYAYVKANGRTYYGSIIGGKSVFVIPVELNKNNTIIGMTTKMTAAHEIAYSIYVYLAAAGVGGSGALTGSSNEKLDEEAPQIMGLEYQSETVLEYAEYFKLYHYDQGITLLEIDMTRDTARDPERLKEEEEEETSSKTEKSEKTEEVEEEKQSVDTAVEDGEETARTSEEITAELYKGNIVKYLIVPEDVEIPAGLDKEMIVIQQPADGVYLDSDSALVMMDALEVLENITAVGFEKEDCELDEIVKAMEDEKIVTAGTFDDLDYRTIIKTKNNLAILPAELLPMDEKALKAQAEADQKTEKKEEKEAEKKADKNAAGDEDEEELTVEEQTERLEEIAGRLATLKIPMLVDRSWDEKTDLAKLEWVKVYGALFGAEEKAEELFKAAVEAAEKAAEKTTEKTAAE